MGRKKALPVRVLFGRVRKQSMKVKTFLVAWKFTIEDHIYYFLDSDVAHIIGIIVLLYKLVTKKTCSGISLKTQELTALFLAVKLFGIFHS